MPQVTAYLTAEMSFLYRKVATSIPKVNLRPCPTTPNHFLGNHLQTTTHFYSVMVSDLLTLSLFDRYLHDLNFGLGLP